VNGGRGKNDGRTHPRLTVVQGAEQADPAALDDVLEMLVKWAIRAQEKQDFAAGDALNDDNGRGCATGN